MNSAESASKEDNAGKQKISGTSKQFSSYAPNTDCFRSQCSDDPREREGRRFEGLSELMIRGLSGAKRRNGERDDAEGGQSDMRMLDFTQLRQKSRK